MNTGFDPFPWLALILLAVVVLGTLRARRRLRALPSLAAEANSQQKPSPSLTTTEVDDASAADEYRWLTAAGVRPGRELTAAAAAYARREGLLVLDLVPAHLPVEPLLDLLGDVDPARFRDDPVATGRGAYHALLVHRSVLERALITPEDGLESTELIDTTALLKQFAPREMGHVVAPGMTAGAPDPRAAKARMRAFGAPPAIAFTTLLGQAGAFAGATYATPFWGLLALAAWWVQPYAVLVGRTPARPRGVHRDVPARPALAVYRWVRGVTGPAAPAEPTPEELAAMRARYAADVADGTGRFFEERRDTCPWCGSNRLAVRVRTKDRLQGKPGRFTLEQCRGCRVVFQNPRLSPDGLDYYYRDFYDGLAARGAAAMFATMSRQYLGRARLVRRHAAPGRWLDVGTGHAHMCLVAKSELPDTVFDGLDLGGGVEEAARRGWIEHAYVGQFPDHADALAGAYDVVSMNHYLEHARDVFAELDAAAKVVQPGGHLLVEIPDPECWYARLLRRRWHPWFQPQHQHLVPLVRLTEALAARGFTVVEVERGPAHQGGMFVAAVSHTVTAVAPNPRQPWIPARPTLPRRIRRVFGVAVFVPVYMAAGVLDALTSLVARKFGRAGGSDAYRLLARKDPG
ncbi:methyltransferase domain-containing protein [Yinghuangia sp. YIM S09857]|uniref:class I SAM-dependent methyltransferase n=1 Tax=Yinghuangia sp. YIM S09857 TaxID=3436929 RepID=UPI003F53830F